MRIKLLLGSLFLAALALGSPRASAQLVTANVVAACGTPNSTYGANTNKPITMGTDGKLCDQGSGGGGGGTSSNFNSAFPASGTAAGASDGTNMKPFLVDGSGNLKVNVVTGGGSGGTSSTYGAAFPGTGTAIGVTDGTDMRALAGINYTGTSYSGAVSVVQALPAGTNVIGHVIADTGSTTAVTGNVTVVQPSAASLNATVVGTGTFATQSVVTQGTASNLHALVTTNADGSASGGTAASVSLLTGGIYNSSPITLTTGQQAATQLDTNGYLNVHVQAGGGSGGTSSTFGATFPSTGTAAGFTDGTNMQPGLVDASKRVVTVGAGTAGSPAGGLVTIQGTASMTRVLTTDSASNVPLNGSASGSNVMLAGALLTTNSNATALTMTGGGLNTNTAAVNGVTVLAGTGAVGTGAQRIAVGTDTATIAGSAPGTAGSASANVVTVQGIASGTVLPVTATNLSSNVAQFGGSNVVTGTGAGGSGIPRVTVSSDSTVGLVAGSALVGKVGIDQTTPGTTNGVTQVPATSGGLSIARIIVAANTTSVAVKSSAGQVYHIDATNNSTTVNGYLKLYNIAQGSNTCGSNTPIMTFMVPFGGGLVIDDVNGFPFATAISACYTTGLADADTGAPVVTSATWNIGYK